MPEYVTPSSHAEMDEEARWRQLSRMTGGAGVVFTLLTLGPIVAMSGGEPAFDGEASAVLAYFLSTSSTLNAFGSFLVVVGIIAMVWFAIGDAARCEDVGSEAAAVNQFAQHALVGESLQVGAGLTEPAPDAFDVADPEALSDKGVQVDAAGDDVASSLRIPESVAVGQGEFVEHFDQRQVVADAAPAARGEGADAVGVSVAVQASARDRPCGRYLLHGRLGAVGDRYDLDPTALRWPRRIGAPRRVEGGDDVPLLYREIGGRSPQQRGTLWAENGAGRRAEHQHSRLFLGLGRLGEDGYPVPGPLKPRCIGDRD